MNMSGRGAYFIIGAFFVTAASFLLSKMSGISYADDIFAASTKVVGALVVIAVFLERSMAVINSLWFGSERQRYEAELQTAGQRYSLDNASLKAMESDIAGLPMMAETAPRAITEAIEVRSAQARSLRDETKASLDRVDNAQKSLEATKFNETQTRLIFGFLFALLVAAAGARTLEPLFGEGWASTVEANQLTLVHMVDIVLTAGLLAGGSQGIHAIADIFGNYAKRTSNQAMSGIRS